MNLNFLQRYA